MPTLPASEAELRDYLVREVGPIPPRHWRVVERNRWDRTVLDPEGDEHERVELLAQLVADLRDMRSPTPVEPPTRSAEVARTDPRFAALARITALEAAERSDVLAFRREHLKRGLLSSGKIERRIRRWANKDGSPTFFLRVPLPDGAIEKGKLKSRRPISVPLAPHLIEAGEALTYPVPQPVPQGSAGQRRQGAQGAVRIRRGGVLGELKVVCRALASELGWSEPQAVAFVLCGSAPRPAPGSASCSWSAQPLGHRITLEVHPSMSQREVAALYEQMRAQVTWWPRKGLSERQAALAAFVAEVNDGRSWAEAMAAWNARLPAAAYPENARGDGWRTFGRDATRAFERVHGGAYRLKWLGRPGRPRRPADPPRRKNRRLGAGFGAACTQTAHNQGSGEGALSLNT